MRDHTSSILAEEGSSNPQQKPTGLDLKPSHLPTLSLVFNNNLIN